MSLTLSLLLCCQSFYVPDQNVADHAVRHLDRISGLWFNGRDVRLRRPFTVILQPDEDAVGFASGIRNPGATVRNRGEIHVAVSYPSWADDVLAHELMHAVTHDRWGSRFPHYLSEGLAMSVEREATQLQRLACLRPECCRRLAATLTETASGDDGAQQRGLALLCLRELRGKHGPQRVLAWLDRHAATAPSRRTAFLAATELLGETEASLTAALTSRLKPAGPPR